MSFSQLFALVHFDCQRSALGLQLELVFHHFRLDFVQFLPGLGEFFLVNDFLLGQLGVLPLQLSQLFLVLLVDLRDGLLGLVLELLQLLALDMQLFAV